MTIDACVAQHIGDREEQQDRAGLYQHPRQPRIVLAVVADGMGGHTGGSLAAEQVTHTAKTNLEQFSPSADSGEALLEASLREAHLLIRGGRFINEQEPHSTGVMLLLQPRDDGLEAHWAHCGDSRLYHFRGSQPVARTTDHSYVEELLRAGTITTEQAAVHPQRNLVVTSLGGREPPLIDCGRAERLVAGDSFILCSDGLWAYFGEAEMGAIVASFSARQAAETLLKRARERCAGKGDNCTLVILKLVEVAKRTPPRPR